MRIVALAVPIDAAELASDRLWGAGARGVEERHLDAARVELRTFLGDDAVARERLGELPAAWSISFVEVDDEPAQTWRRFVRPIAVTERLVLRPAWQTPTRDPTVLDVAIEPGGAFGLGDHPTTRLSAAAADALVRPGHRVADVGCGSGVLSIIAAARGAARVVAIDISAPAVDATLDNARRNRVSIEASTTPLRDVDGGFDLVLANLLAPSLIELAADLRRVTDVRGRLVVSGVLADGYDHVLAALAPMCVLDVAELDGWAAVTLAHPVGDGSAVPVSPRSGRARRSVR